jgi:hypothetical protein
MKRLFSLRDSVCAVLAALLCLLLSACSQDRPVIRTYAMGEKAEAGLIVYSVLEFAWRTQLGEAPNARLPRDRFLLLRLSVTNGSPHEVAVPLVTLVSMGGKEYPELTDGAGVEDWFGVLRRLEPNETAFGWVLFDAPRADYQLRVSDDAFDPADAKLALIQIPLRLEGKPDYLPLASPNR